MTDLSVALTAAQKAGDYIRRQYSRTIPADIKSGHEGLVTRVDRDCEHMIYSALTQHSTIGFVGEEHGHRGRSSEQYWCVDPIDGTSNFFRKLPVFAVSIALIEGDTVKIGVIHDPLQNLTWHAERGKGAFVNGTPIAVSDNTERAKSIVFINHGHTVEDRSRTAALNSRLGPDYTLRMLGSTAIELCCVADGRADVFICSGDALWDYAAGILLVEEAGGKVSDWRGNGLDFQSGYVFASNGFFHPHILEKIAELQAV